MKNYLKHKLSDYHLHRLREEYEEEFDSVAKAESNDKTEAEDNNKDKTITKTESKAEAETKAEVEAKTITITKTEAKAEDEPKAEADSENEDGIIFSIKNTCVYCDKPFRSKKILRTHKIIHLREKRESSDTYNITSSSNNCQLYISRLDQDYITNIDEYVNYGLEDIIPYKPKNI